MLSDCEVDSLFGDDIDDDYEVSQPAPSNVTLTPRLALPSLKRKSDAVVESDGINRVGTSTLSASPLPVSEHTYPTVQHHAPSSSTVNPDDSLSVAGPPRSQVTLFDTVGLESYNPQSQAGPSSSTSTAPPTPALAPPKPLPRPKKRPRTTKSKPDKPDPESKSVSFGLVMQALSKDATVTNHLNALLAHLKPGPEGDSQAAVRRVDPSGRTIPPEEWKAARTQDLIRQLSLSLKRALRQLLPKKPTNGSVPLDPVQRLVSNLGRFPPESGADTELQTIIQQWIFSRLTGATPTTPSATPPPATPSSLPNQETPSITPGPYDDFLTSVGMGVGKTRGDSLWDPGSFSGIEDPTGLGIFIPSLPPPQNDDPFGFLGLSSFEDLLRVDVPPQQPPTSSTGPPAPDPFAWLTDLTAQPNPTSSGTTSNIPIPPIDASLSGYPLSLGDTLGTYPIPTRDPAPSNPMDVDQDVLPRVNSPTPRRPAPSWKTANAIAGGGSQKGRVETALSRAEAHRKVLQEALENATSSLWDLEIEQAVLSNLVKDITAQEVLLKGSKGKRK